MSSSIDMIRKRAIRRLLGKDSEESTKRTHKEDEQIERDADYDADRTYDDPREDTNLHHRRR